MFKKLPHIFLALLFSLCCSGQESEQAGPVLSFEIPSQNLLRYNRYLVHPAFSALGTVNTYISFHHRNQWADYDNSPEVYLANYSGKINERTGFGIGLFQQSLGVIDNFGLLANYAYSVQLAEYSRLTLGVNISYYRSGINWGNVFIPDAGDPALQNMENSSLIAFHPGINLSFRSFNIGVFAENIVNFNLKNYQSYIEGASEKRFSAHIMHTLKMEMLTGVFEDGEMTTMIRGRKTEEEFFPSASLIVNFPRLGWLQVGYDDLYGAAAGIGFNLTRHLSLGYTVEKGLNDNIANFGTTHEFELSYAFKATDTPRYYTAPGKKRRPAARPPRPEVKPVVKKEEKKETPVSIPATGPEKNPVKIAAAIPAIPSALRNEVQKDNDSLDTEQKKSVLQHEQLDETRLTAARRKQIQDSIEQAGKVKDMQIALSEEKETAKDTASVAQKVAEEVPVIQDSEPDIEDLLFEAAAKQENIRTKTATLVNVADGYYIIANVFRSESNLTNYMTSLRRRKHRVGYFKNPANELNYVYVKKYDTWEEAINQRRKHARELNNKGVWVFRVKNARTVLTETRKPFAGLLTDSIAVVGKNPEADGVAPEQKAALNLSLPGGKIRSSVKNAYIPVDIIESVPVFPGCENLRNNEERKACLANGIDRVIQRRFRASVATGLGLSGVQGIYVAFKVGADGEVSVIRIKAPHKKLEEEAKRVIGH
ncbi:PorP/SprF family type IX secretion system membrane protein, partial [Sinomicrobium weinanense]